MTLYAVQMWKAKVIFTYWIVCSAVYLMVRS